MLKKHFVVGWKNIRRADFVGSSHGYTCEEAAVGTTNGAGPRNTQIFVLAPDGVVLHCLPGFWHPEDLAYELDMARVIYRLWKDKRSKQDKRSMFARFHRRAIRTQPRAMIARSGWQGFDASNERKRLEWGPRDTFYYDENNKPGKMKPLSVLVHERMAARPFVSFSKFDTEKFIDYGRPYYDNNVRVSGTGVGFGGKGYMASQKRMAERREKRAEQKRRTAEYYGKNKKRKTRPDQKAKPRKKPPRPTSRPSRNRR